MNMAKTIKPRISSEVPYPGKRPETIPETDVEELQVPDEDPDLINDPEAEEGPPDEPPIPGEGP
jgi:hypothetical protein